MWRIFKTSHEKVTQFRSGRARQSDERFIADCEFQRTPDAARHAIAVRRAVANVGLIDPLFIFATDRFPEDLGMLPLWDSMDWVALMLELEDELGQPFPNSLAEWRSQNRFTVKQLVQAVDLTLRPQPNTAPLGKESSP